jgi:hypothetical protein
MAGLCFFYIEIVYEPTLLFDVKIVYEYDYVSAHTAIRKEAVFIKVCAKITLHFSAWMHPHWLSLDDAPRRLRCESLKYIDISSLSLYTRRAYQR